MKNKGVIFGAILLVTVIAGALYYQFYYGKAPVKQVQIKGYMGGEKKGFLANPKVLNILKKNYGISLDATKAGSIEMVRSSNFHSSDFLWPSSQVALELFKMKNSAMLKKSDIIFNSPIVLYSWDIVTEKLIKAGIVEKVQESYYIVDFPKLINLVIAGKNWSEIGLDDLYGKITIISTDPTKSNSGNMFSGLLANILNNDVVTMDSINNVLSDVVAFFKKLGYLEHSSGDLFEQYLRKGVGALPIIVGYENQIVEFSLEHKELWPKVKDKIRILYPIPTVWSSHPLISLNDDATHLIQALQDEQVQKLAWESHGFRSGLMGIDNDPKVLDVVGIPENITKVIPMPSPEVMDTIINALSN